MLRVAVPNKGSLSEAASAMLAEAGYRQRRDTRELVMVDPDNDIEFFFLRPRDIAVYVGQGLDPMGYSPLADIGGSDQLFHDLEALRAEISDRVDEMPSHRRFIKRYRQKQQPWKLEPAETQL